MLSLLLGDFEVHYALCPTDSNPTLIDAEVSQKFNPNALEFLFHRADGKNFNDCGRQNCELSDSTNVMVMRKYPALNFLCAQNLSNWYPLQPNQPDQRFMNG